MFASSVERCFFKAFFRWNKVIIHSNHTAHNSRRLISSSAIRRTSASQEPASSEESIPAGQPFASHDQNPPSDLDASQNPTNGKIHGSEEQADVDDMEIEQRDALQHHQYVVRNVFRSVAHPVAVVTALAESESESSGIDVDDGSFSGTSLGHGREDVMDTLRAMTVSSLNTVSMNPTPIISFNVRTPSSTWDAIQARGRFRVHMLRAGVRGRDIATGFAKGDTREGYVRLLQAGSTINLNQPGGLLKLSGDTMEWVVSERNIDPNPAPYIKSRALGFCLQVALRPEKCVQVNDHVIVVGEVEKVQGPSKLLFEKGPEPNLRTPMLSYVNHTFVTVNKEVEQPPPPKAKSAPGAGTRNSTSSVNPQKRVRLVAYSAPDARTRQLSKRIRWINTGSTEPEQEESR